MEVKIEQRSAALERFMSKVEKTENCWNWKAQICKTGYGAFWLVKVMTAHRASWILHKGKIPKGKHVCHTCDNRSCVNPNHLWIGTHQDNMDDMVSKGRVAIQKSILDKQQQEEIHKLHLQKVPQREIAKIFNVHQMMIWKIIHKKFPIIKMIGEKNNKAVLTKKKVLEMRSLYEPRKMGFHRIAKKYGVDKSTAMQAIKGETWKHI